MKDNSLTLHHRTWVVLHDTMCETLQIRCEVNYDLHALDTRYLNFALLFDGKSLPPRSIDVAASYVACQAEPWKAKQIFLTNQYW